MSANANKERRLPAGWCAAEDYSVSNRGLRTGLVGTPEQIAERLDALERIGIDLTLLQFSPQAEEMERFAEEVIAERGDTGHFPNRAAITGGSAGPLPFRRSSWRSPRPTPGSAPAK